MQKQLRRFACANNAPHSSYAQEIRTSYQAIPRKRCTWPCFESFCGQTLWHLTTSHAAVQNPIPPSEKLLFTFKTEKDLARWSTFSDQEFGGQSEASLALSQTPPVRGTAFAPCMQNLCAQASAVGSQSVQNATYSVLCRLVSIQNTANALVDSVASPHAARLAIFALCLSVAKQYLLHFSCI